jgi:hypothetical protein
MPQTSGIREIHGPARHGGKVLPVGLFLKSMHSSDFSSPIQRMTSVRTPPLCADHFRLSLPSMTFRELNYTAYLLSRHRRSSPAMVLFNPLNRSSSSRLPITYGKSMLYACRIMMPMHIPWKRDGAASRAGFPLVSHLCGPLCHASPRISFLPSKGLQSQSSECSPDGNSN